MTDLLELDGTNDIVSDIPGSVAPFGAVRTGHAVPWVTTSPGASLGHNLYYSTGIRPSSGVSLNPSPGWIEEVLDRARRLSSLPAGWDGHRSRPVSHEALTASLRFIVQLAPHLRTPPSIVPTVSGGVALEWHRGDLDLEIEFPISGQVMVMQCGPDSIDIEAPLEAELPTVIRTLLNLA